MLGYLLVDNPKTLTHQPLVAGLGFEPRDHGAKAEPSSPLEHHRQLIIPLSRQDRESNSGRKAGQNKEDIRSAFKAKWLEKNYFLKSQEFVDQRL